MTENENGLWVVFEGVDYSGKSTVIDLVYDELLRRDLPVAAPCAEPNHLRSQCLDESLADDPVTRQMWFALDARLNWVRDVYPHLESGEIVLQDRGAWSADVYSGLEDPLVESLGHGGHAPDLTVLVDVYVETVLERRSQPRRRPLTPSAVPSVGSDDSNPSTGLSEIDYFDAATRREIGRRIGRYRELYWAAKATGEREVVRGVNALPGEERKLALEVADRVEAMLDWTPEP